MKTKISILTLLAIIGLLTSSFSQNFTDVTSSTNLTTNMDPWSIVAYDFNNDSKVDLVYTVPSSNFYQFFKNNGNNTFSNITPLMGDSIEKQYELKFCDFNKDGLTDIIAGKDSGTTWFNTVTNIKLFQQTTSNTFINITTSTNIPLIINGSFQDVMDYDQDGDIDIIYATRNAPDKSIKVINNRIQNQTVYYDSITTIANLTSLLTNAEIPLWSSSFDYDNDNDEDILYSRFCTNCGLLGDGNFNAHQYGILRNDSNGVFTESTTNTNIGCFPRNPIIWDYNNDGIFDLISGNTDNLPSGQCVTGSRIIVKQGNPNGTFTDLTTTTQLYDGLSHYYRVFGVCDFNNDYKQDVLSEIDRGSNPIYKLYQNNGTGAFTDVALANGINLNTTFGSGSHVWMDYDNDGSLDLFANLNGVLKVFKNNIANKKWIKFRLYGCSTNTDAYGVKVVITANGKKISMTPAQGSSRMRSDLHIGLDTASVIDSISVYWHKSPPLHLTNVSPNQYINIYENQSGSCFPCTNVTTIYNYINVIDYDTVTTYISVTDTLFIDAQITGLPGSNNINTIKVYPNPSSTHITIDNGNFSSMSGYSLDIRNSVGAVVFGSLINQQQFYLDISSWSGNGTYLMSVYDNFGNLITTKKIIIQ